MQVSSSSALAPPSCACISSRCLIRDKHAGQCRPHHNRPSFAHHANNRQAMGPPLCCALIDSSPLTRFMGVRTVLSVTSNWSAVPLAGWPGPWLAGTGQLSPSMWKTMEPLWWIFYSVATAFLWIWAVFWVISISVSTDVCSINCWEKTTLRGPLRGQISKCVKASLDKAEPLSLKQTNELEWLTFRLCYSVNLSCWELNLHCYSLPTPLHPPAMPLIPHYTRRLTHKHRRWADHICISPCNRVSVRPLPSRGEERSYTPLSEGNVQYVQEQPRVCRSINISYMADCGFVQDYS